MAALDPLDPRSFGARPSEQGSDRAPVDPGISGLGDIDVSADEPSPLEDEDRELLVALAAFQLRYGEAAEAVAYLMAARTLFPRDPDTLRLLADALTRLGRVEEAEEVLADLDVSARSRQPLNFLTRAMIRLAQGRAAEARRLFLQYRDAVRGDSR